MRQVSSLAALMLLTGCASLAPRYERPALPTPSQWPQSQALAPTRAEAAAALPLWREFYADPKLRGIIEIGLKENRDLRVAALNVERARAAYRFQRAEQIPTIDASVAGQIARTPAALSTTGADRIVREYSAGAAISAFELDLFGRVRSLSRAALEDYLSTKAARDGVQISLISEIASAYLVYAADRELLKLAQDTLASQTQSLDLTRKRFDAGAASMLDVRRAQTTVERARADAARYTIFVAQDENALALLLGAPVPETAKPGAIAEVAFGAPELAPKLPSEVLLARPDIEAAEHDLRAANANIGAARAAFFPSVSISAFGGQADPRFENLFSGSGGAWSFAPQLTLPIFSAGRNFARLGVAKADRAIALANYERAIQAGFRDVADALAERGAIEEEVAARAARAEAAADVYRLSDARYRQGVDSYLSQLDAQRELYAAQQDLVGARLARATNFVTLYKALGGGADRAAISASTGSAPTHK